MASKLEVEVDVKSSADKFWDCLRQSAILFPKIFPEIYKSIEIIEGDGMGVGNIRHIIYAEGVPMVTFAKEKIEVADEKNKTIAYSVIEGDIVNFYKNFKATLQVLSKGDGALVKWKGEFDKANDEVPEPTLLQQTAAKTFKDLDEYLLKT
ncbi:MLP-like protein 423 [Aristolochia californica]|uniref:MLP-like protein 423 n=1 Tax=Aristolochia californica TaxID=171875 RepID=UPI0035DD0CC1